MEQFSIKSLYGHFGEREIEIVKHLMVLSSFIIQLSYYYWDF